VHDNQKDLALIDRILTGDQFAYRALINRHKEYAFTVAYRILGSREDAEEVAQDAFMSAFRALGNFNRESKFTTWFYRIVFNAAVAHKRKHRVATEQIEDFKLTRLGMAQASDELKLNEQRLYIQKALNNLLPDDVTMITLFYLKEFSLEEIADITGIAANTAKVKIHRARKRLAEELSKILKGEVNTLL
jgi:RNA polymerase sigma-70 factor (ECF subfamily)